MANVSSASLHVLHSPCTTSTGAKRAKRLTKMLFALIAYVHVISETFLLSALDKSTLFLRNHETEFVRHDRFFCDCGAGTLDGINCRLQSEVRAFSRVDQMLFRAIICRNATLTQCTTQQHLNSRIHSTISSHNHKRHRQERCSNNTDALALFCVFLGIRKCRIVALLYALSMSVIRTPHFLHAFLFYV